MDIKNEDIKELKVNERLLARYYVQGDTVFIKIEKPYIIADSPGKSEDFCIMLISLVDNVSLRQSGYLNVK